MTNQQPLELVHGMFLVNEAAKNDKAVQIAMASYMERLAREEEYRAAVREGRIQPQPTTAWNISDRD